MINGINNVINAAYPRYAYPCFTTGTRQAWQRRQGFYRYLNVAALPCSLIPTPPDDEQSPDIFHLQEDFA